MAKVKDYLSAEEFTAWMDDSGWTPAALGAAGVAGGERNIYRMRSGERPVPKVLALALVNINKATPRKERGL